MSVLLSPPSSSASRPAAPSTSPSRFASLRSLAMSGSRSTAHSTRYTDLDCSSDALMPCRSSTSCGEGAAGGSWFWWSPCLLPRGIASLACQRELVPGTKCGLRARSVAAAMNETVDLLGILGVVPGVVPGTKGPFGARHDFDDLVGECND